MLGIKVSKKLYPLAGLYKCRKILLLYLSVFILNEGKMESQSRRVKVVESEITFSG